MASFKKMKHYCLEGIENFRDVGGYETPYGETAYGVIYRSGSLFGATEKDLLTIKSLQIKTIIDLRSDDDKAKYPSKTLEDKEIKTIYLPTNGNGRVPRNRFDQVNSYLEMLEDKETASKIFRTILNAPKPLLIHCHAGKDRTGVFISTLLLMNGVSIEDVNADYLLSFPYTQKLTAHTKAFHKEFSKIIYTPSVDFLYRVFKKFNKKYGGLDGYFSKIGFSEDEKQKLSHLLEK